MHTKVTNLVRQQIYRTNFSFYELATATAAAAAEANAGIISMAASFKSHH